MFALQLVKQFIIVGSPALKKPFVRTLIGRSMVVFEGLLRFQALFLAHILLRPSLGHKSVLRYIGSHITEAQSSGAVRLLQGK